MKTQHFILICVWIATVAFLSIFYYTDKLQSDMWLKRISELQKNISDLEINKAKQEADIDVTKKTIADLQATLTTQSNLLSGTVRDINDKNNEIKKIEKALYYLNESLWIQN